MTSENIEIFGIQEFCDTYLSEEVKEELYYSLDKHHTYGDCDLSAITGETLLGHLTRIDVSFKNEWLDDHLEDLFELDLSL
jgi:hypothetical protein